MKPRVALVLFAFLSSCASAPEPKEDGSVPEWVRHPETRFPSERYLASVGVGNDRESAIRDAKKNMAESFLVRVMSATRSSTESSLSKNTEGALRGESGEIVKKEVSFDTVARLRGAEVKDVMSAGGQTYALLALDRLAARSGLLLEANRLKAKLENGMQALEEGYSAGRFQEARSDLEQLRELGSEAAALNMGAILSLDSIEGRFIKVESEIRERNRNFKFRVSTLKGDERFARNLEICIQEQGGVILSDGGGPETAGQIRLSVIEQPQHLEIAGWVKIKYEVSANLIRADGKSIRISESRTETARSKEAALESVADGISKKICEQTWNRLGELK
jgi:hypothetical protein